MRERTPCGGQVRLRVQFNRVGVLVSLMVLLPAIAIAEKLRSGLGGRFAKRAIRRGAALCGVRISATAAIPLVAGQPIIIVANHSSLLDIPAVILACDDVRFVGAAELFKIPLLAAAMRGLGTVPLERRKPAVARAQLAHLARAGAVGASPLAIFPQGAIEIEGTHLPFKSGAFALAIDSGAAIVPLAIHGSAGVLPPRRRLAVKPGDVVVEVLAAVDAKGLAPEDRRALRERVEASIRAALRSEPTPTPAPLAKSS